MTRVDDIGSGSRGWGRGPIWRMRAVLNNPIGPNRRRDVDLTGKVVLITGASSGIGRAAALRLGRLGASVVLVARREPELRATADEIGRGNGSAIYRACDLADTEDVEDFSLWVLSQVGTVDILVNNAGRSMRRPIVDSFDRMHDFHRTMAINFFGPVQLSMRLLPSMLAKGAGQIINIGTWTVPVGTSPRFSAYHSSKMALTGFGRCVEAELGRSGIRVSTLHYPLVHTEMSSATGRYSDLPGLSAQEAAEWIVRAIRKRPVRIVPRYAAALGLIGSFDPRRVDRVLWRLG